MELKTKNEQMELLDSIIHSSMNIAFGIGLAIIIAAVLLIIVFTIKGKKSNSLFGYLHALILAVFLSFQFSLMFGAITAKKEVDNISDSINGYVRLISMRDNTSPTIDDIASIVEKLQNLVPDLSEDMGQLTLGKVDKNDIGGSLMAPAKSYLNKYIIFRILWSLLFVVVATISMIILSNYGDTSKYRKIHIRGEKISSRRSSDGRRLSRRSRRY